MPRRKEKLYQGGAYHIYNRGAHQKDIFRNDEDKGIFLRQVRELKEKFNITIFSHSLMPNHFHFGLRQDGEEPISKFMKSLTYYFSIVYNKKYDGSGHLFEGNFHCKEIKSPEYLVYLSFYIHLNPIDLGFTIKNLHEYPWSSYPDYIGLRKGKLVDTSIILSHFGSNNRELAYKKAIEELQCDKLKQKLKVAGLL